MDRTQVFKWHKKFREGREDLAGDAKSGWPSTSRHEDNVKCVKVLVRADHRLTVRMVAEELALNKRCGRCASKLLNDEQNKMFAIYQDILDNLEKT